MRPVWNELLLFDFSIFRFSIFKIFNFSIFKFSDFQIFRFSDKLMIVVKNSFWRFSLQIQKFRKLFFASTRRIMRSIEWVISQPLNPHGCREIGYLNFGAKNWFSRARAPPVAKIENRRKIISGEFKDLSNEPSVDFSSLMVAEKTVNHFSGREKKNRISFAFYINRY